MLEGDCEAVRIVSRKMLDEANAVLKWDGRSTIRLTNPLKVARIENGEVIEGETESALSERSLYYDFVRELQVHYICSRNRLANEPDSYAPLQAQSGRIEKHIP
jgi:hypothetical protein